MEKALYELPQGLEAIAANQEPLEIEIEDPEAIDILEIESFKEEDFDENLAESIDPSVLSQICNDLIGDVDADISSRKEWMQT